MQYVIVGTKDGRKVRLSVVEGVNPHDEAKRRGVSPYQVFPRRDVPPEEPPPPPTQEEIDAKFENRLSVIDKCLIAWIRTLHPDTYATYEEAEDAVRMIHRLIVEGG
jgi:hypothetical protein